jgi:hypothetical protein
MRTIKKEIVVMMITTMMLLSFASSAHCWLWYSKPEFHGRVVDSEKKEPIEGAVAVVLYTNWEFGGPGGGSTVPMDVKETLSDKNGEFHFPSYWTLIGPLSRKDEAEFIFFKPGYKSITKVEGVKIPDEKYFAIGKGMIGVEQDIRHTDHWGTQFTYKGPMGIVKMEKGERDLSSPTNFRSKELPLLFKALNEDRKNRGYKGELK